MQPRAPRRPLQETHHLRQGPGWHDLRYAIDASRIESELGWKPSISFEDGLAATVDWYLSNGEWLDSVTSGAYQQYYDTMYGNRG